MNLDVLTPSVYIRILLHISLSCHVNNNVVVLSVFNKHTLIVRGYYFFNLLCERSARETWTELHYAKRDFHLSIQHMEVSASRSVHFIAKISKFRLKCLVTFFPIHNTSLPWKSYPDSHVSRKRGNKGDPKTKPQILQKIANRIGFFPEYRNRTYMESVQIFKGVFIFGQSANEEILLYIDLSINKPV